MFVKLTEIVIKDRQRKDLGDVAGLAKSLSEIGLINPITIDKDKVLIAGRRRLEAARQLQWSEIRCEQFEDLTETQKQLIEYEEDIRRKDRTWQEKCLALYKLHQLKRDSEDWTIAKTADFTGIGRVSVGYMLGVAEALLAGNEEVANSVNYTEAFQKLLRGPINDVEAELNRRRAEQEWQLQREQATAEATTGEEELEQILTKPQVAVAKAPAYDPTKLLTLKDRADLYNQAFPHLMPLVTNFREGRVLMYGIWFLGGPSQSDFYGSYSVEYLKRIVTLFPDKEKVVHLFSGAMPPGPYTRVGIDPTGLGKTADIIGDAEQLSSFLPFKADLIYADPPYSVEDSEHYGKSLCNRAKVLDECANSLVDDGFVVWLDQALPVFRHQELALVGLISYIRSTGNRFRCVCIFQKNKQLC